MTLRMSQVPGLFGLGSTSDDYKACRDEYPVDEASGYTPLNPGDPCWDELVAWRRATGRDPLGRDLWGAGGAPLSNVREETLHDSIVRCMEQTGKTRDECRAVYEPRSSQTPIVVITRAPTSEGRRVPLAIEARPASRSEPDYMPYLVGATVALLGLGLVMRVGGRR